MNDALDGLERLGYAFLPGAFERGLVEKIRTAYVAYVEGGRVSGSGRALPVGDRRFLIPVEVVPPFDDPRLLAGERVFPILKALLGDELILNSFGSVLALPGAAAQARHKDHDFLFPVEVGAALPCYALTLVVPLVDLDESTGTTALCPGSHRRDEPRDPEPPLSPSLALGDALVMDYRLSHFGTANPGKRARPILYIVYSRRWFLDERNFYSLPGLRVSPESRARLGPELGRLFARADAPSVLAP